jgi:hypothetical protein
MMHGEVPLLFQVLELSVKEVWEVKFYADIFFFVGILKASESRGKKASSLRPPRWMI